MIDIRDYIKDLVLTQTLNDEDYVCFYSIDNSTENTIYNYDCYFSDELSYSNGYITSDSGKLFTITTTDNINFEITKQDVTNLSVVTNRVLYTNVLSHADIKSEINSIKNDNISYSISPIYLSCLLFAVILPVLIHFVGHFVNVRGESK